MNRRTLLAGSASALAAACGPATSLARFAPRPRRTFAPVLVDERRIIRTVVGLRPFRPSGFVVRAEPADDRLIIHNYGHGGGGISLSWGSSHLAADLAPADGERRCAVIGCGVMGLTTARLLQRRGWEVTIYARDLPPDTTSNIAGGQWSPFSVFDQDRMTPAFREQFVRAARLAHRHFQNYLGAGYGVRWIENYIASNQPIQSGWMQQEMGEVFQDIADLSRGEHPFPYPYARRITTMLVEPAVFLAALLHDVQLAGARIVVRTVASRDELLRLEERVVFNCAGLGARETAGDTELTPVKGQLHILLPQPEVDYIVLAEGFYMFPRSDGILLGGTFVRGDWSLEPDPVAMRRILEGHARLFAGS